MKRNIVSGAYAEEFAEFCEFLCQQWSGRRVHSYRVPNAGKSASWSMSLNPVGQWSATGLRDAMQRYSWNGQDFLCNEEELTALSRKLQSAIKRCCNDDVGEVAREIMRWGGVDSVHRQKRTFAWIAGNSQSIAQKLTDAVNLLADQNASLDRFDGIDLIMNSAMTKIISLSDPKGRLVIYDSRVAAALGYFVARFAEETMGGSRRISSQLRFAVARQKRRKPYSAHVSFPALFGTAKDRAHATMMRTASRLITEASNRCVATRRQIEAGLFMWGYDVLGEEPAIVR
jgi:hypothetical protein